MADTELRVIVPYTRIHPLTASCLEEFAPNAERVFVGDDDQGYGKLFRNLWYDQASFLIVEHDIQFDQAHIDQAKNCPCGWSSSYYPYGRFGAPRRVILPKGETTGLKYTHGGFSRYSAELMAAHPHFADELGECRWSHVVPRIHGQMVQHGIRLCRHIDVGHHHRWESLCSCGDSAHHVTAAMR